MKSDALGPRTDQQSSTGSLRASGNPSGAGSALARNLPAESAPIPESSSESVAGRQVKERVALYQGLKALLHELPSSPKTGARVGAPGAPSAPDGLADEPERLQLKLLSAYLQEQVVSLRREAWSLYLQDYGTKVSKLVSKRLYKYRDWSLVQENEGVLLQNGLVNPFLTLLKKTNALEIRNFDAWLVGAVSIGVSKDIQALTLQKRLEPLPVPGSSAEDEGDTGPELPNSPDSPLFHDEDSLIAQLDREKLQKRLSLCLEDLPADERRVLSLYYIEGLTQQEIADLLKTSVATVNRRLEAARQQLRRMLDPYGIKAAS